MQAPRMRVAVWGHSRAGHNFARRLEWAGHTVENLENPAQLDRFDALILAATARELEGAVGDVAKHVRPKQIVIHTSLLAGVEALDELETRGCVTIAAAPLGDSYAVGTLDEVAETVIGLLLSEIHQTAETVPEAQRAERAARLFYAEMLGALTVWASIKAEIIEHFMGSSFDLDADDIIDAYPAAVELGMARNYRDVARMVGEQEKIEELELWAVRKGAPWQNNS
ncbi:hypothetical protein FQN05_06260 [Corynebacterium aurimucosum]|uniref:Uncharacterized protein n=1 Tax=Corynebacterium aurimucosum TaxID=169292 RepID=A0A558IRP8_9CORY|nr:hypothetical protein [Corynebacterium aurimucosum]TVU84059.1 hypothetical protein FQN05_06260 [Corynebacterium aurimucosum]